MAKNPDKSPRSRSRPTRQEELARALAALGCDPDLIDPKRILAVSLPTRTRRLPLVSRRAAPCWASRVRLTRPTGL